MWWLIIILIVVGALLLVAELVLLPGLTIAGIGALGCYAGAAYVAWDEYGVPAMLITIAAVVVVSLIAAWLSLRARTWQRFSLKHNIEGQSQESPEHKVKAGDRGVAVTRLAPMGKVMIGGETYEAKAIDALIDPQTEVEVTGFENFNVIVRPIDSSETIS